MSLLFTVKSLGLYSIIITIITYSGLFVPHGPGASHPYLFTSLLSTHLF